MKVKDEWCDARDMLLIGELSARTGVSPRSLRYYEEQGLLEPTRSTSGYRRYPASAVGVVGNIKTLLEAGLNTEAVRGLLPCMVDSERFITCSALLAALDQQLAAADERLAAQRHARNLLAGLRRRAAQTGTAQLPEVCDCRRPGCPEAMCAGTRSLLTWAIVRAYHGNFALHGRSAPHTDAEFPRSFFGPLTVRHVKKPAGRLESAGPVLITRAHHLSPRLSR